LDPRKPRNSISLKELHPEEHKKLKVCYFTKFAFSLKKKEKEISCSLLLLRQKEKVGIVQIGLVPSPVPPSSKSPPSFGTIGRRHSL
jgi:hypothetical protein